MKIEYSKLKIRIKLTNDLGNYSSWYLENWHLKEEIMLMMMKCHSRDFPQQSRAIAANFLLNTVSSTDHQYCNSTMTSPIFCIPAVHTPYFT